MPARVVEANLAATGLGDRATVVVAPAERVLGPPRRDGRTWDLALLDPPYAFDGWPELLAGLPARVAVVESDRPVPPPVGWGVVRERRYGTTVVAVLTSVPPVVPPAAIAPPE